MEIHGKSGKETKPCQLLELENSEMLKALPGGYDQEYPQLAEQSLSFRKTRVQLHKKLQRTRGRGREGCNPGWGLTAPSAEPEMQEDRNCLED